MKTEEDIRRVLKEINKVFYNEDYNKEQIEGAVKALKWVLED